MQSPRFAPYWPSPGDYYARRARPPSARTRADAELCARIAEIHRRSRAIYGLPRIDVELREQGLRFGCKRGARLRRAVRPKGVSRRRWVKTTVRDHDVQPSLDDAKHKIEAWRAHYNESRPHTALGFVYAQLVAPNSVP